MAGQIITPAFLEQDKKPRGKSFMRVSRDTVTFSKHLAYEAKLSHGQKVAFYQNDEGMFFYISEDGFPINEIAAGELRIYSRQLSALILGYYNVKSLIENGESASWSFTIESHKTTRLVEGIEQLWKIQSPKKLQS